MVPNAPPPPVAPPAKLGTPVMFPGRRLEMPFWPVIYRLVGTGTPLTEAAVPLLGPLLPSDPAADTFAVLPLFNVNEAAAQNLDWIGESAAETIHESLGSAGLMVLARDDREEVYRRLSVRGGDGAGGVRFIPARHRRGQREAHGAGGEGGRRS